MFCKQCGNELNDGAMFCTKCGASQGTAASASAPETNQGEPTYQQPVYQQAPNQGGYTAQADTPHNGSVGFGEAVKLFFKNYVNFNGRASKSEYWWGFLFYLLLSFTFIGIYVGFLGMLSLAIRRLHDIGKPWTWYLLGLIPYVGGIILIIFYCKDSDGDNQWGRGPAPAQPYNNYM